MTHVQKKTVTSKDGASIYYEIHKPAQQASFKKVLGSPRGLGQTFSQELVAPATKPALFLVHGIGGDSDGWQYVREHLLREGYTTISMDVRGHGHSHHPKYISDYELTKVEEDIDSIISKENVEQPVLIGHSGGAIIAAQYAVTRSEKLKGLVLIAGSYCPPSYLSSPLMNALAHIVIRVGGFISPPAYKNWHSPYPAGKHHKEFEIYGLIRTLFYNSLRSYLYLSKALITADLRDSLKHITVPALLISGQEDGIFPTHISQKMQEEIPAAKLVVLEKTNHVSILNNPKEVSYAILHFLRF
jgi:pimeloyl-ACP methyl ester carboxylesterase